MLKKKLLYKKSLKFLFSNIENFLVKKYTYKNKSLDILYSNIFRISTSFKQLFFSFLNLTTSYMRLLSTGVLVKQHVKSFKFFKKSIFVINPLVMIIKYSFINFFKKLYFLECLNYSKKQFLFLKKFLNSVKLSIKFLIFKKTWIFTSKPVKRIKRRITKLLKNV